MFVNFSIYIKHGSDMRHKSNSYTVHYMHIFICGISLKFERSCKHRLKFKLHRIRVLQQPDIYDLCRLHTPMNRLCISYSICIEFPDSKWEIVAVDVLHFCTALFINVHQTLWCWLRQMRCKKSHVVNFVEQNQFGMLWFKPIKSIDLLLKIDFISN